MTPKTFQQFEQNLRALDPAAPGYRSALDLFQHVTELRALATALTDYLDMPGPTPEKTAEYYQLAQRARAMQLAMTPNESMGASIVRVLRGVIL